MSNFRRLYDLCNDPDRLCEFAKHPVGTREQLRISWMELETNCIPLPRERYEQMAERLCGFINHQLVDRVSATYCSGVRRSSAEKKMLEGRLTRLPNLPKWSVTIAPPEPGEIILPG